MGPWEIYVDGSDLKLTTGAEDVNSAWIDTTVADKNIYMSTRGSYNATSVNSITGDADDVFGMTPFSLGDNSSGFFF
ncbi:MAG: hypothetical protein R2867_16810 [Caldilineaceae bacterium]